MTFFGRQAKRGMAFIELLVAVAVTGFIAVATGMIVFTFSNLWLQFQGSPQGKHHMDGVVSFLQFCLDNSTNLSPKEVAYRFEWTPAPERERKTIKIRLSERFIPFFVTEIRPFPTITAYLDFVENEGLFFLWHVDPKYTQGRVQMRRTLISDQVKDIEYGFWDDSTNDWVYESVLAEGASREGELPARMRVVFGEGDEAVRRDIRLWIPNQNVFIY